MNLRQEIQNQCLTHNKYHPEHPELYKVNAMTYEQMYPNIVFLFASDNNIIEIKL